MLLRPSRDREKGTADELPGGLDADTVLRRTDRKTTGCSGR